MWFFLKKTVMIFDRTVSLKSDYILTDFDDKVDPEFDGNATA